MKNLKVSKKLIISYAFVLILLVVIIAVSIGNLISIRARVEAFYNGPFKVLNAANTVNSSFEAMQKSVFRAISNTNPVIAEQALEDSGVERNDRVTVSPSRIKKLESRSFKTESGIEIKIPAELCNSDDAVEFIHSATGGLSLLIKDVLV